MPSASTAKPEKHPSTEGTSSESSTSNTNQQNTPIRQAIVIIEHKIRNLDKRKAKLETYRELQRAGKDLNQDQKVAVAKYDEVSQTLEFARDLCKQFHNIVTASEKEAKKLARKEELHRRQQDIAKFKEVLLIQDALAQMGADNIREDFLLGRNGAAQISPEDLQLLDDLYPIVSPKHASESEEGRPEFTVQVQQAAEHLLAVVDGRQKEFQGSTFAHIKQVINTIHSCGYLEKPAVTEEPVASVEWTASGDANALPTDEYTNVANVNEVRQDIRPEVDRIPDQMPPMPNFPPVPEQVVQQTVVPVVEQPYYQPPPQPQPRPINEMLETGSFYFLQESELDSPDLVTPHPQLGANAPIPSQTFTNQNFTNVPSSVPPLNTFASTTNLPPPIPMPPSHSSVQPPPINPTPYTEKPPTTFNSPQTFDTYTNKKVETETSNIVTRDNQKNGNEWSESSEERQTTQSNRPRGNNSGGGNRNRSTGGSSGYYQNNYYQNNGYGSGGYKSRGGGGGRQGGGSGGRQGGVSGGNKGGGGGGSGQYNRSKPSQQH